jgi:hypothetical protein
MNATSKLDPRKRASTPRLSALACGLLLALGSDGAWAYIDPNAGGFLLQLLAPLFAAIVGAWIFLRRWIAESVRRLWGLLTRRKG